MGVKAIILFSGGLDSILAARILQQNNIEVEALHIASPFIHYAAISDNQKKNVIQICRDLGIKINVLAKRLDFLDILRNPQHGFGKNMNPCIDCRIYMLKIAKRFLEDHNGHFLATGEVVGQRPMSQRMDVLQSIDGKAGCTGIVLRPLSAGLLPETIPEKNGWVDKNHLLSIRGRSRKEQMALAKNWGITDYPSPAGGCLLTDPGFAKRLRHLMNIKENFSFLDVHLLKVGRHLILGEKTKLVVSRNEDENGIINHLKKAGNLLLEPDDFPGPVSIIVGPYDADIIQKAAGITLRYGKPNPKISLVNILYLNGQTEKISISEPMDKGAINQLLIKA